MALDSDRFRQRLATILNRIGRPPCAWVALSGGRDSSVLLDLVAATAPSLGIKARAVHVHHGLHPQADDWAGVCASAARERGLACEVLRVDVAQSGGDGLEANARAARYGAFANRLGRGDWLLTAHHRDDQAETVLLNLMRGAGVAGVRGAAAWRPLARGFLVRPLLDVAGNDIAAYAVEHALRWVDDPSNSDTDRDRNYLRQEVLPRLVARWPAAARQLARSAELAADAAALLGELAAGDLAAVERDGRLEIAALSGLSAARRASLLRLACERRGLPALPSRSLAALERELLPARDDASPCVRWPGAEARRYRGAVYLLPALSDAPSPGSMLTPGTRLALGSDAGCLRLAAGGQGGIRQPIADAGLGVRFREGGESLRPAGRGGRHSLKKLLQEEGIVPWMRDRIPLLFAGDTLAAVGDLWVDEAYFAPDGLAVCWDDRPPLH